MTVKYFASQANFEESIKKVLCRNSSKCYLLFLAKSHTFPYQTIKIPHALLITYKYNTHVVKRTGQCGNTSVKACYHIM